MTKKKDDINKVNVQFIGNNSVSVTGSCTLVTFYDSELKRNINILLELGMIQDGTIYKNYTENTKLIESIKAKEIDFVILNHAHVDHSGLLPSLISKGFSGKYIMTKETCKIVEPLLYDSAYIIESECKWLKENKKIKAKPHYTNSDICKTIEQSILIDINEMYSLTPKISVRFLPNRHILGAVSCELFFTDTNSRTKKLFYSSDLGNNLEKSFIYDEQKCPSTSTVSIYESTYGFRSKDINITKKKRQQELDKLADVIRHTIIVKKGICLFPAFSLDRTPNLLRIIKGILDKDEQLKNTQVIIDGKLSNELLSAYSLICDGKNKEDINEILNWNNLKRIQKFKETEGVLRDKSPKIVLSSSGFCLNGHILTWLRYTLPHRENTIVFTGYSPTSSLASKIKEKDTTHQKTVTIDKFPVLMNADVLTLETFSSHIQREDLIKFILQTKTHEQIVLVHGDLEGRVELKEDLEKRLDDLNRNTKVYIPCKNSTIKF